MFNMLAKQLWPDLSQYHFSVKTKCKSAKKLYSAALRCGLIEAEKFP